MKAAMPSMQSFRTPTPREYTAEHRPVMSEPAIRYRMQSSQVKIPPTPQTGKPLTVQVVSSSLGRENSCQARPIRPPTA